MYVDLSRGVPKVLLSDQKTGQLPDQAIMISGGIGSGKCIEGNSLITLSDGTRKPIRFINIGDRIISYDQDGNSQTTIVKNIFNVGKKIAHRLTLTGGFEILCSVDHKFLKVTRKERKGKSYGSSRTKKIDMRKVTITEYEWIKLSDLKRMDLVAIPKQYSRETYDIYDTKLYELIGYILGDGGVSYRNVCITIENQQEVDHVRTLLPAQLKLRPVLHSSYGYVITTNDRAGFVRCCNNQNKSFNNLTSPFNPIKEILKDLKLFGKKSTEKHIPEEILMASDKNLYALLSGLITTDGWVEKRGVGYCTSSDKLKDDVCLLLKNLGITFTIHRKRVKYRGGLKKSWQFAIFRRADIEKIANNCNLVQKQSKLIKLLETKNGSEHQKGINKKFYINDMEFCRVSKIEEIGQTEMYDLETESETHNYIADNIIVHNSSALESYAWFFYNHGYKIIHLTDQKDKFESAFCIFEPTDKYHVRQLVKFGVPVTSVPCKILHPFTFTIPKDKIPEIQFYTMPLKSIGRQELSFISETDQDTSTIKTMIDTLNDLKAREGLPHLIFYAENKAESQENYKGKQLRSLDPNAFFTKGAQGSTLKTINTAIGLFKPFQVDFFLAPLNCELNLDMASVINDQKHYTILATKYIRDPKMKHFAIDNFLHELDRTISQPNVAKYPICLIIDEVRKLTPVKTEGYTIFLANDIKELLSICRNKGEGVTEIMATQVYFDVHKDVRKSATETVLGSTGSLDELEDIAKALSLGKTDKLIMSELRTGEFVCKSLNSYTEKWRPFRPPHMHADKGKTFEKEYAERFPDKMRTYDKEKEYMKNIKDRLDSEVLEMARAYNTEIINSMKNKEKEKQERAESKIQKHTETVLKKERKITEMEMQRARQWKKQHDEGASYQKISDAYFKETNNRLHKEQIRRAVEKIAQIDTMDNTMASAVTETQINTRYSE